MATAEVASSSSVSLWTERDVLVSFKKNARDKQSQSGVSVFTYSFKYNGVDDKWFSGHSYLSTKVEEGDTLTAGNGREIRIRTCSLNEKDERENVLSLTWKANHSAILKPIFVVYNPEIDRIVSGFTKFNMDLNSWIAKQTVIQPGLYIPQQGKAMICSVLDAIKKLLSMKLKFVGLRDPKNYVMLDNKVKILPSIIHDGNGDDADERSQLNEFSDLLMIHLYPRWQDADLLEFIKFMREPTTKLVHLVDHPLLLSPNLRELFYRKVWLPNLNVNQTILFNSIQGLTGWQGTIPESELVLRSLLVYPNGVITYSDNARGAHKYCRDTSSHYMRHAREQYENYTEHVTPDIVDSKLKKTFPGFISKIYAVTCKANW